MKLSLEQLSARMRQGETIPSRQTAQVALALSIPSILEQLVVTAMGYIDAAMVGHIGAEATASIGIVHDRWPCRKSSEKRPQCFGNRGRDSKTH